MFVYNLVFAILTLLLPPLALLQLNFDLFSSTYKEEEMFHEKNNISNWNQFILSKWLKKLHGMDKKKHKRQNRFDFFENKSKNTWWTWYKIYKR